MANTIRWEVGAGALPTDQVKIYRATSAALLDATTTPLASLDVTNKKYFDNTTLAGIEYHYQVRVVRQSGTTGRSIDCVVTAHNDSSIGPKDIIWGDTAFGYYGMVDAGEFTDVSKVINITTGVHKFIHGGRNIYVSHSPQTNNVGLLANGTISGGVRPGNLTGRFFTGEADKFHKVGDNYSRIRLAKFFDRANADLVHANYTANMKYGLSEFMDIARFFGKIPNNGGGIHSGSYCMSLAAGYIRTSDSFSGDGSELLGVMADADMKKQGINVAAVYQGIGIIELFGCNPDDLPSM